MQPKAISYVRQSDPPPRQFSAFQIEAVATIDDAHPHSFTVPADIDRQLSLSGTPGNAVDIGVLDDRLQDQCRNQSVVQFRLNQNPLLYSSRVALLLHGHVNLDELHLFAERNQLHLAPFERHTQQAAQLFQHLVRRVDVGAHQARDAVHRVEEEMRIELHAQRGQPRLYQLHLELRRRRFLLPKLLVVGHPAQEQKSAPENRHAVDEFRTQLETQPVPIIHGRSVHGHPWKKHDPDHLFQNAGRDAERQRACNQRYDVRLYDEGPQESPHQPANCAPDKKLHPPHFDQKQHADPVTPAVRVHPFLQSEQDPDQHRSADEDKRMHEERLLGFVSIWG